MNPPVVIACDWSGRRDDNGGTWVAKAEGGNVVDLRPKTRRGAVDYVLAEGRRCQRVVAGIDFAFSFPSWFVEEHGPPPELWTVVRAAGEEWLSACPPPFWGLSGTRRPGGLELFRLTEQDMRMRVLQPKSAFQIAGAGAVGTGSIRGMPHLGRLEAEGFAIWPFASFAGSDGRQGRWPRVVEIYPRALTGPVNKSSGVARSAYLDPLRNRMTDWMFDIAAWSEDAFDAVISALAMADHADELDGLRPTRSPTLLQEGEIWIPRRLLDSVAPLVPAAQQRGLVALERARWDGDAGDDEPNTPVEPPV